MLPGDNHIIWKIKRSIWTRIVEKFFTKAMIYEICLFGLKQNFLGGRLENIGYTSSGKLDAWSFQALKIKFRAGIVLAFFNRNFFLCRSSVLLLPACRQRRCSKLSACSISSWPYWPCILMWVEFTVQMDRYIKDDLPLITHICLSFQVFFDITTSSLAKRI